MAFPRRYGLLVTALMALFLVLFAVVEALEIPLLVEPQPWLGEAGLPAAVVGVALLVADVFLPVPASLVMVAHGALFGILGGTLLSLVGSMGAAAAGFWVGRRGGRWVERAVGTQERAQASALIARWGALAILVTRPIPIVAETTAIMAGAAGLRWSTAMIAALLGAIPAALMFALAGALAVNSASFGVIFLLVLALGAIFWWSGRRAMEREEGTTTGH